MFNEVIDISDKIQTMRFTCVLLILTALLSASSRSMFQKFIEPRVANAAGLRVAAPIGATNNYGIDLR